MPIARPRFVLAVLVLARSDKLLETVKKLAAVNAAACQVVPLYTRNSLDTVLKYKSPVVKAFPSLSNVGLLEKAPKYVSSKLSAAARAAAAEAAAAVALVAAFDACVVAVVA